MPIEAHDQQFQEELTHQVQDYRTNLAAYRERMANPVRNIALHAAIAVLLSNPEDIPDDLEESLYKFREELQQGFPAHPDGAPW